MSFGYGTNRKYRRRYEMNIIKKNDMILRELINLNQDFLYIVSNNEDVFIGGVQSEKKD